MSYEAKLQTNINAAGLSIQASLTVTGDSAFGSQPALAAAKTGTLTTRTDDNTGVATLGTGHGILTGDVCDVYWTGGIRRGMTATVAGNAVTLDGGAGDVLPAQDTAVAVSKQTTLACEFDGDTLEALFVGAGQRCVLDFLDDSAVSQLVVEVAAAGAWSWMADSGIDNPLAGHLIESIKCSCGGSATTLKVAAIYNGAS